MAVDKLVDSTQLDADLTSVANAIRAKSGGSSQLSFPAGFVSEIGNIETGGGSANITDFSGGNILAIVGNGSGYFTTDYAVPLGLYGIKFKRGPAVSWEHFFGLSNNASSTGLQRYQSSDTMLRWYTGQYQDFTPVESADGTIVAVLANLTFSSTTANHPLLIFKGYYNQSVEAQTSKSTFYGLNILRTDGEYAAKFVPWLDNDTACIKDLISGTIYHNSGSGSFSYIDLQGVLHSV